MGLRLKAWVVLLTILVAQDAWAGDTPELSATISLPVKSLKADQRVTVPIWLANSSSEKIQTIEVEIAGVESARLQSYEACPDSGPSARGWPGLIEALTPWKSSLPLCKGTAGGSLGPIEPHKVIHTSLCICLGSEVQEGDYKLLFVFRPSLPTGASSVVTAEKEVEVGLFGPQTVGGFSLRLMSLFVPGLVFLWLFPLFWGTTIISGIERGVGAVLVSALLLAGSYGISPPGMPGAMSVKRLISLILVAVAAAAVGGIGLRKFGKRVFVQIGDTPTVSMKKLLLLRRVNQILKSIGIVHEFTVDNPKVWLANEKVVCGCLMGRTPLGWIIIPELRIQDVPVNLRGLLQKKSAKLRGLLLFAEKSGFSLTPGQLSLKSKPGESFKPSEIPQLLVAPKDLLSWESRHGVEWEPLVID